MAGICCLILSVIGASTMLHFLFLAQNSTLAVATIPAAGASFVSREDGHTSDDKQFDHFFDEYFDPLHGSPPLGSKRWQWAKRQVVEKGNDKTSGEIRLSGTTQCEKKADIIITILSYNQAHIFVIWTEACKDNPVPSSPAGTRKGSDESMETGCDETHSPIGLGANDDIAVILPDMMEKIIKAMYTKYGRGCFEVYYRYAEIEWSNHLLSKEGSFNSAVTRMRAAVKVI